MPGKVCLLDPKLFPTIFKLLGRVVAQYHRSGDPCQVVASTNVRGQTLNKHLTGDKKIF